MEKFSKEEREKARAARGTGDSSLRGARKGRAAERERDKKKQGKLRWDHRRGGNKWLAVATSVQVSPPFVK